MLSIISAIVSIFSSPAPSPNPEGPLGPSPQTIVSSPLSPSAAIVCIPDRHLVVTNLYGLTWSPLSGVPSGEMSIFLGSSLRPRSNRRGGTWKSALGYELTGSAGGADFHTAFFSWGGDYGIAYHRHHIAALGYGGPNDRLYYHFGGGVMIWRATPIALEADAKLGVVLGGKRGRVKGIVGGQVRLVGVLSGIPLPTFGIFAGLFVY